MSTNDIHVGDVGTVITATIKDSGTAVDISAMTTKYFLLRQPGGTTTTISASFVGSGTAGAICFTSASAHFDAEGVYKLQAFVASASNQWHTDWAVFTVYGNLG